MKSFITIAFLLTCSFAYSQVNLNKLSNNICECFQNLDSKPKEVADIKIKECLSKKEQLISSDIETLTTRPSDYLEFVKLLVANCTEFAEYVTKHFYSNKNLTDKEYTENIYQIIEYFKQPSEYGKMAKSITVSPLNVGLRYNIVLHKTYTDSVYKAGSHLLEPNDSLIIFDIKEKELTQSFETKTKDGSLIKIVELLRYNPVSDSVGAIFNMFGLHYEQMFIIPEIRIATRKVTSNLSSSELYRLTDAELENRVLEAVKSQSELSHLFEFVFLNIESIKYPHITKLAKEAGLIDAYEQLSSKDPKERQEALGKLFKNGSKTAYLIILTHWQEESEQENLDFILEHMTNK